MDRARVAFWSIGALWFVLSAGIIAFYLSTATVSVRDPAEDVRKAADRYRDALQNVTAIATSDPEMVQARAQARATLVDFWRAMASPGPGEEAFALKVAFAIGPATVSTCGSTTLSARMSGSPVSS